MTEIWRSNEVTRSATRADGTRIPLTATRDLSQAARLMRIQRSHTDAPPQLRKKPMQSRSRLLVDSVKQACLLVVEKEGIDGLSVSAISEASGVTFGSIYQYFPNLDGIIAAVYDDAVSAAITRASRSGQVTEVFAALEEELKHLDLIFHRDFFQNYYRSLLEALSEASAVKAS